MKKKAEIDFGRLADIVDAHEWSRFGGSYGEQIADLVEDFLTDEGVL